MFSKYYLSELTYLRDLGKEFAAANPALSAMFADKGGDPDVERLLEGFAFLTARIRERIDDAMPEIVDAVCELTLPQFLQPIPACTIVEFTPTVSAMRGRSRIPKGTELGSKPVEGSPCYFRTTQAVDLLPLTLAGTTLDSSREHSPSLKLSFRTQDALHGAALESGLRLYLNGPWALTSNLMLWFGKHLESVTYRGGNGDTRSLPVSGVKLAALDANEAMLPWPENAPDDMRLLLEFFTLPQKFLFLHIDGFSQLQLAGTSEFELEFSFKRPPALADRIERDLFRLHCVPAINRFEVAADPISKHPRTHEYLVRAAGIEPRHCEVARVKSVTGIRQRGARVEYTPFLSFDHTLKAAGDQAYYVIRRAHSPLDHAYDAYISLLSPRGGLAMVDEEVLSLELECSNRNLASALRAGDVSVATPRSPSTAKFTNLTQVSKPVRTPLGSDMHWRLIAHLALNQRTLADVNVLRSLLSLYNVQNETDQQAGRANRVRIEAIRSNEMRGTKRVIERVATRGAQSTIEIDEQGFASLGDLYLFSCALDALYAHQAPVNAFHALRVRTHPSGEEIVWPARTGLGMIF